MKLNRLWAPLAGVAPAKVMAMATASAILVGLFSFGVTVPAQAEAPPGTDTSASTNLASIETLHGTSIVGNAPNPIRQTIQEDGSWEWLDTTANYKNLLRAATTPAGIGTSEQYPGESTLFSQFYQYINGDPFCLGACGSFDYYQAPLNKPNYKFYASDGVGSPIDWSGTSKLPGNGGLLVRVGIYGTDGTIVPNARFRAQLMAQNGTYYGVLGNGTGKLAPENSIPKLTFYDCDPSASSSCAPIAGADMPGGVNPTAAEAYAQTNAQGYAYVWVTVSGPAARDLSNHMLRISDAGAGDTTLFPGDLDYSHVFPATVVTAGSNQVTPNSVAGGSVYLRTAPWVPSAANNPGVLNYAHQATVSPNVFKSVSFFGFQTGGSCLWGSTLADPASAASVISPISRTAGTGTSTLTVSMKNRCGGNLSGQEITVVLPNGDHEVLTTNSSGVATYTIPDPVTVGSVNSYPTFLGNFPTGTPTTGTAYGSPTMTYLAPPVPNAGNSTVVLSAPTNPADGTSSATVIVTVNDQYGNPVPAGTPVCFSKELTGTGTLGSGPWVTDANGQVTTTITAPTFVGSDKIEATLGTCDAPGASIGTVDVEYVPGPPSAGDSVMTIDKSTNPADGSSTATVTVTVTDANGNPVPSGTSVCLSITLGDGTLSIGPWTTDANGQVTATVTSPTTVGSATIHGTLGTCDAPGGAIGDVNIDYVPGPPSAADSTIAIDKTTNPADGSTESTVTVTILDENGNIVASGTEVCLTGVGDGTMGTGPWTSNADGTVTTKVTSPTTTGSMTVTAHLGSCASPGAEVGRVTVDFVPGDPSAGDSTIEIDKTTIPADGSSTATVTVTVTDAFGNNVPAGTSVCLAITLGDGTLSNGPWTTDANGQVTAIITAPGATGSVTISGTLGTCDAPGDPIGDVNIDVIPVPSAPNSGIEADKTVAPADGTSLITVTMTIRDSQGNTLPAGAQVCLAITNGDGTLSNGPWETDENGEITATVTAPSEGGSATVTGWLGSCDDKGAEVGAVNITFVSLTSVLAMTGLGMGQLLFAPLILLMLGISMIVSTRLRPRRR